MDTRIHLLLLCAFLACSILSTPVAADPAQQRDATLAEKGIVLDQPAPRRSLLGPPAQQEVVPAQTTTQESAVPPATAPYQQPTTRNSVPVRPAQADDYVAPSIPQQAEANDGPGVGIGIGLGVGGAVTFVVGVVTLGLVVLFFIIGLVIGVFPRFYWGSSRTQDWASVLLSGFLILACFCSGAVLAAPPVWGFCLGLLVAAIWAGWKLVQNNYGGTTPATPPP